MTEQMLLNVSKSTGIWVNIKVRILTETSWKWIRLSQSFSMSPLIVFCQLPCYISLLLSMFLGCSILQVYHSLSLTVVPTIFPLRGNDETLTRVYLVSRHSGRSESLWNISKNFFLTDLFAIILIWGVLMSTVGTRNKLHWGRSRWDTYSLTQHSQKCNWFPQESLIFQHWRFVFKEA